MQIPIDIWSAIANHVPSIVDLISLADTCVASREAIRRLKPNLNRGPDRRCVQPCKLVKIPNLTYTDSLIVVNPRWQSYLLKLTNLKSCNISFTTEDAFLTSLEYLSKIDKVTVDVWGLLTCFSYKACDGVLALRYYHPELNLAVGSYYRKMTYASLGFTSADILMEMAIDTIVIDSKVDGLKVSELMLSFLITRLKEKLTIEVTPYAIGSILEIGPTAASFQGTVKAHREQDQEVLRGVFLKATII